MIDYTTAAKPANLNVYQRPAVKPGTLQPAACAGCGEATSTEYSATVGAGTYRGDRWIPVCWECREALAERFDREIYNATKGRFEATVRAALGIADPNCELM